ncbi:MAG: endonuclease domain-containing protein [Oscillospiraceae bacterium]|nr:endonuclease domain-containing protein [Oscillospiraceae bacterium]MBQ2997840.1 endonuclease domain-containing protein [Oscillospiraceae bacterium]MBQ3236186.1 endonuclease domain-containing protein [Oscillospiraceae bacterium]MBQ3560518.1 endonuclease domain-containing protein [Oscillospiraceae bacterium]MBQ4117919.1 endonuclease domain-containing protein [Oscillospiraceae bacterium]
MDSPKGEDERVFFTLPRNIDLVNTAKELRRNMTFEEKTLWYRFLSSYPIRFKRQKTIGNYIVDFYCDKAKLVVEIDGAQHYKPDAKEYDKRRTEYFESLGLSVIRFLNSDIDVRFEETCNYIDKIVKSRLK